jgi:hypothetical protein
VLKTDGSIRRIKRGAEIKKGQIHPAVRLIEEFFKKQQL